MERFELKIRNIAKTQFAWGSWKIVEFRANQPTGGDLRPISAGSK
jgi:hypothetical protein